MSWNRIVLSLFITFSILSSVGHAKELMKISEDELIVTAILYDEYKAFENSYKVYKKLFDDTGAEIYLFKEATSALMSGTHIAESITRLKVWQGRRSSWE